MTVDELRSFVWVIDDVVVDVVVIYDVGDIAWLHRHLFFSFRPALVHQPCLVISVSYRLIFCFLAVFLKEIVRLFTGA